MAKDTQVKTNKKRVPSCNRVEEFRKEEANGRARRNERKTVEGNPTLAAATGVRK
jgi:hypothetical protein